MKAIALGIALLATAPAIADPVGHWQAEIAQASVRFGVPSVWIERVMRAESGGLTTLNGLPIISRAGAIGLMQLMPATWADMRRAYGLGSDPHDPHDNIQAGTAYLRVLYDRFGYPGLFAAYNAGPGRYADHLASGRPLPNETQTYLAQVTDSAPSQSTTTADRPPPSLFILLRNTSAGDASTYSFPAPQDAPDPLFAVRR